MDTSPIENKVAKSGLITLDLEEMMPAWEVVGFNIGDALWQGLVLKEQEFRDFVKRMDWSEYTGKQVHIYNEEDAIIPTWAYMLIAAAINPFAATVLVGTKDELMLILWLKWLDELDLQPYSDQRIIIKGCSKVSIPQSVYLMLTRKLVEQARSIMFGEPCSTVPVFKKK